jgi:hypothetical protein
MPKFILLIFALVFPFLSSAQSFTLKGTLTGAANQEAIPYVNIGIKKKNIGTATRPDGTFTLSLKEENRHDTLTFSAIGYNELSLPIASILSGSMTSFELSEKTTALREVVISSKAPKIRKFGTTSQNPFVHGNVQNKGTHDIIELGKFINLNNKTSEIVSASVYLRSWKIDAADFRINFYKNVAGMPGERLIEKSIVRRLSLKQGWVTIPLEVFEIIVDEDFYLGIEYLPDSSHTEKFMFSYGAAIGGSIFSREVSLGTWEKGVGGRLAAYVTVRQ